MYEHKYKKIDFVSAFENLLVCRMEGPFWEKIERKSRNSRRARGGEVGAKGMVTKGAILRSPGTKYQRSKNVFASTPIALTLVPLGTKLLEISAQFLPVPSPRLVFAQNGTSLSKERRAQNVHDKPILHANERRTRGISDAEGQHAVGWAVSASAARSKASDCVKW